MIIKNKMGGSASREPFPESRHYSILDYGYCKVWKRSDSQVETMEQYEIVIDSQRMLEAFKRMWMLRAQEEAVVGVYYFTHRANKELCGFYQQGSILTERIPYRLSQFSNLPYEEMLFVLRLALRAYLTLHSEYGLFLVRSTMMGINLHKQVKVWHHTDFSAAEPENVHCRTMAEMLDSIIQSVELNAQIPMYYPKFSDFLKVNRGKIAATFQETLRALQTYLRMNKIPKCEGITKLANHLRQAQGWQERTCNSNFLTNLSNISQLNKSSFGKYSFRGTSEHNSSVSSSGRTLKNSPSYNLYTQKEVRLQHRTKDKDRSALKAAKSQVLSPFPQQDRYQYSPKPLDIISDIRGRSIQKGDFNKIQIKIPSRRNAVSPPPQSYKPNTISSIDRRIIESPQPRFENVYTHKESDFQETQPIRANRFHQSPNVFQRRNQSISPSGIYYQRN